MGHIYNLQTIVAVDFRKIIVSPICCFHVIHINTPGSAPTHLFPSSQFAFEEWGASNLYSARLTLWFRHGSKFRLLSFRPTQGHSCCLPARRLFSNASHRTNAVLPTLTHLFFRCVQWLSSFLDRRGLLGDTWPLHFLPRHKLLSGRR